LNDADKTKGPLMSELAELRRRVAELEARETEQKEKFKWKARSEKVQFLQPSYPIISLAS
jgi:hypothetical protein